MEWRAFYRDATELEEHTVSQTDSTREHLIETYPRRQSTTTSPPGCTPRPATPSGHNASGPYKRSAFARVAP